VQARVQPARGLAGFSSSAAEMPRQSQPERSKVPLNGPGWCGSEGADPIAPLSRAFRRPARRLLTRAGWLASPRADGRGGLGFTRLICLAFFQPFLWGGSKRKALQPSPCGRVETQGAPTLPLGEGRNARRFGEGIGAGIDPAPEKSAPPGFFDLPPKGGLSWPSGERATEK